MGGENKVSLCQELATGINWQGFTEKLTEKLTQANGFKLYFATPAIFNSGWLPQWLDSNTLTGEYQGINLKLVGSAIARYQVIGGWDVAYNRPKPTLRAVSAGSVYYFTTQAPAEKIIQTFHWQNLADDNLNAQIGFGLTNVGIWNYCYL
jgi:CRISPR-associated protein Cmr3